MSASEDAIIGSPPLLYSTLQGHDLQGKINGASCTSTKLEIDGRILITVH